MSDIGTLRLAIPWTIETTVSRPFSHRAWNRGKTSIPLIDILSLNGGCHGRHWGHFLGPKDKGWWTRWWAQRTSTHGKWIYLSSSRVFRTAWGSYWLQSTFGRVSNCFGNNSHRYLKHFLQKSTVFEARDRSCIFPVFSLIMCSIIYCGSAATVTLS